MKKKNLIMVSAGILIIAILISSYFTFFYSPYKFRGNEPIKIFWLDSYHEGFWWSTDKINGYKNYLDEKGVEYELKEFHLDSIDSGHEALLKSAQETKNAVDEYEPDLIFSNDDKAQEYVSGYYLNSGIPWVFSGVNKELEDYNFHKAKNVAGLLERKPTEKMMDLIKQILPGKTRLTLMGDESDTGKEMKNDVRYALELAENKDHFEIVDWYDDLEYFEEVKEKFAKANEDSDFIIYESYWRARDEEGKKIPGEDVSRWIVENSNIPEVGFWNNFAENGGFLAVETDPYDYGREAAKITERILIKGESPSSIKPYVPEGSIVSINLARARQLGLEIPSIVLVNSNVYETFPWEVEE